MKHLAIIMDGNGRWATERGLPRLSGHAEGAKRVLDAIEVADALGIKYLSLYAFSNENFKRNIGEVMGIFGIIADFLLNTLIPIVKRRGYSLRFIGNLSSLSPELLSAISQANVAGLNNSGMKIIIAVGYSGTEELTSAFNHLLEQKVLNADFSPITEANIRQSLYTATIPDPDAVVRYGGHQRLSNFMPFQTVYSELFFLKKLFPDFQKEDIYEVYKEFMKIKRNFGDVT